MESDHLPLGLPREGHDDDDEEETFHAQSIRENRQNRRLHFPKELGFLLRERTLSPPDFVTDAIASADTPSAVIMVNSQRPTGLHYLCPASLGIQPVEQ